MTPARLAAMPFQLVNEWLPLAPGFPTGNYRAASLHPARSMHQIPLVWLIRNFAVLLNCLDPSIEHKICGQGALQEVRRAWDWRKLFSAHE